MSGKVSLAPKIVHFYPWPLVLATCVDEAGRPNIITLGAASPCSYAPPTIGIAVAPARYSHQLIAARGEFGVNIPARRDLERADWCGCVSGRDTDKFAETGFTPLAGAVISVPLIAECPINFECRLIHTAHLASHDWFIGEIVAAHADPSVLTNGQIDPAKLDGVHCSWGQYFAHGEKLGEWNAVGKRR
jgi:flavin reductase (DIM6/NTAB) family NADH-FMN oxidoreductase RutF